MTKLLLMVCAIVVAVSLVVLAVMPGAADQGSPAEADAETALLLADSGESSPFTALPPPLPDVNGDGCIDVLDVILAGQHFGETGAPGWIPEDVTQNGTINVLDIVLILSQFGQGTCPGGSPGFGVAGVGILPLATTVSQGEVFSVDVGVAQAVPIAGSQFSLSFDPALLAALVVTEGDLLNQDGAGTFFSPGVIDNVVGSVTGVVGAIITPGASVSTPGTFATVQFIARTQPGTSALGLSDVRVGNPQGQRLVTVATNGEVTVQPPPTPTPSPTPGPPTVTAVSPLFGQQGTTLTVNITGTGFDGATGASFGAGIAVNSFTVNGSTEISAGITVAEDAALGLRDVSVTTPLGTGTRTSCFAVTPPPLPCRFHGTVTVGGINVPDGTQIAATIAGDTHTTTTPSEYGVSTYALTIVPPGGTCYILGTPIAFRIGELDAEQTGFWVPGGNTELNLTAGTGETTVFVSPSDQAVCQGDVFTVDVAVNPAAPVSGAQFNLCFNPNVLVANGVAEGNLLNQDGADTYFNAGAIDNGAGCITNVFGAVITPGGSVSTPGTFATISFTATARGASSLDLSNVIVGGAGGGLVTVVVGGNVGVESCARWDVNSDGCADVLDIILVGQGFGQSGPSCWTPDDVNCDSAVNVLDIIVIGQHFGAGCAV